MTKWQKVKELLINYPFPTKFINEQIQNKTTLSQN